MTRSHLPRPIRDVIEVPLEEGETAARWRAIDQRTSGDSSASRMRLAWAGGLAIVAALLLIVLSGPRTPGPVALRDGSTLPAAITAEHDARTLALDDGSTIRLSAGARMRVLDNRGQRLLTLLEAGAARYEVEPGTGRAWLVEAGMATVEVTGTVFEVVRGERSVSVRVERGRVLVRGESLPDRVRALAEGESVVVRAPAPPAQEVEPATPVVPEPAVETMAAPDTGTERLVEAAPRPTARERAPRAEVAAADTDLLAEADAARRAGRIDDALALLARAAGEGGPSGALASLTRGRLLLQSGRGREAIVDLEQARGGGLPRSTQEVATALLVRAYQRDGDDARARALAAEYRSRFPSGRLLDDVELEPR